MENRKPKTEDWKKDQWKGEKQEFNDELDVIKDIATVHAIDEELNSDYIYAKLNEKEERFVTEFSVNANLVKKLFEKMVNNTERRITKYKKAGSDEHSIQLLNETKTLIDGKVNEMYGAYIKRVWLLLILRRNKNSNYIIDAILKRLRENEDKQEEEKKENKILDYFKEKLKKEPTKN